MPIIQDPEFGEITVRRSGRSASMRATISPRGQVRLSVPSLTPLFMVKRMINESRANLRSLLEDQPRLELHDGMMVGKSHTLIVRPNHSQLDVKRQGLQIIVSLASGQKLSDTGVYETVRPVIQAALRKEAKAHLPKRIRHLADRYDYDFTSLRFTHASSRWGSCNQHQAISLNIALMNLSFDLIDYVLLHELAHTVHLNHSKYFWDEVGRTDPDYKSHRAQLKRFHPTI